MLAGLFVGAARAHPLVHLGQLKLPQPPNAMRGQPFTLSPAVNGVLGDTQVLGDVFGCYPRMTAYWKMADRSPFR